MALNVFILVLFGFSEEWFFSCILLAILFSFQVYLLINYLNKTNRDLAKFISYLNEKETNLHFDTKSLEKKFKGLSASLSIVNQKFSEIKKKEHQKEILTQLILDQVDTAILVMDTNSEVHYCNNSLCKLLGIKNKSDFKIKSVFGNNKEINSFISENKRNVKKVVKIEHNIEVLVNCQTIKVEDSFIRIFSFHDISELLDKKELEAWSGLIRVLMHEIMNSLTPISTVIDTAITCLVDDNKPLAKEDISQKDINDAGKSLLIIDDRIKSIAAFVKRFRQFVNIPKPDFVQINLSSLVNKITLFFEESYSCRFVQNIENSVAIFCDKELIEQVLINIVLNAIEASKNTPHPQVAISYAFENDKDVIIIADTGIGIKEEDINKVLIPFYTTKEEGGGIGLSLSRQIMLLHGGSLELLSGNGKTEVKLKLNAKNI